MGIGKIAEKIHDTMTTSYGSVKDRFLAVGLAVGMLGSGFAGHEWAHEEWDNVANENTAQVTEVFNQRAADLRILSEKLDIVEDSRDLDERKLGASWTFDMPEFQQYAIDSTRLEEQLENLSTKYVQDVLLNGDITEKAAEKLMQNYKDAGLEEYGATFPRSNLAYAFKESQAQFINDDNMSTSDKVAAIKSEIDTNVDDGVGMLFALPGMFVGLAGAAGLAAGAGGIANASQRRRKKPKISRN